MPFMILQNVGQRSQLGKFYKFSFAQGAKLIMNYELLIMNGRAIR